MAGNDKSCDCVAVDLTPAAEKILNLTLNNPATQGAFIDELGAYIDELRSSIGDDDFVISRIEELRRGYPEVETEGLVPEDDLPALPNREDDFDNDMTIKMRAFSVCASSVRIQKIKVKLYGNLYWRLRWRSSGKYEYKNIGRANGKNAISKEDVQYYLFMKKLKLYQLELLKENNIKKLAKLKVTKINSRVKNKKIENEKGMFYLLKTGGLHKIGVTINTNKRFKRYKTENPNNIKVVIICVGINYKIVEGLIRKKYVGHNVRGKDWFRFNNIIINEIIGLLKTWDMKFIKANKKFKIKGDQ